MRCPMSVEQKEEKKEIKRPLPDTGIQEAKLDHKPIVSQKEQQQKLLHVAEHGYVETVDQLLAAKVDVDAGIKQSGWTPLFAATRAPNAQVFHRLMDAKADARITIRGCTLAQQVALV